MISHAVMLAALLAAVLTALAIDKRVNAVKAGELVIDPPTLVNLDFEWVISGDDNRNVKAEVSYRKKGETVWKTAMPLLCLQHERVYLGEGVFNVEMPNMFAGSIHSNFLLKPRSAAIDRGAAIPNVTDGFTGVAPNLGALEYGKPEPHYGLRT